MLCLTTSIRDKTLYNHPQLGTVKDRQYLLYETTYNTAFKLPKSDFFCLKKNQILNHWLWPRTIQQLLLTSSKAISFLMLRVLCNANTRAGRSSRGIGKKVLGIKLFEQRFQNVPITKSVVYARRKNFQFFGTYIMLLLSPFFQTHCFTSRLAPTPILSRKEQQRWLRLPAIMWNYEYF